MEEYGFFLTYNNRSDVIRLPVNPESLEIKAGNDSKARTIVDFGQINEIQYPKLREFSFSSFFPAQDYPFVVGERHEPLYYINMIQKWMEARRPIRFVFSGIMRTDTGNATDSSQLLNQALNGQVDFAINLAVSIENFDWSIQAGTQDIDYNIAFKEYTFYEARKLNIKETAAPSAKTASQTKRPSDKTSSKTYSLKPGDSLWTVAKRELGDGSRYREIQKLNQIKDSELRKLPVGKLLRLP